MLYKNHPPSKKPIKEKNIIKLTKSEVQIQYRYGEDFIPSSVLIITWENVAPHDARDDTPVDVSVYMIFACLYM